MNNKPKTFIHTADWHIDNKFAKFKPDMKIKLRRAILRSIELIFKYAEKNDVPLVLCAGDIVDDGQACDNEKLLDLFQIIKRFPLIKVVMITGNHDPLVNQNIYKKVDESIYPKNLKLVEGDETLDYPEWNLKIYASSLREKNGSYNPLAWIKEKELDKKVTNVGLCHGSTLNAELSGDDFPIESDFAQKHGLDYLALGHWHSFKKINDRTYYPGVPEPLTFGDNGGLLKVTIDGPGIPPKVEHETVQQHKWEELERTITGESFEAIKDEIERQRDKEIRKFSINGSLPVDKYNIYQQLLAGVHNYSNIEIVNNVILAPDISLLLEMVDGSMRKVVLQLLELKNSPYPLPDGILKSYVPIDRKTVHNQVEILKENKNEIIDRALLKIYNYFKEEAQ